MGDGRAAPREIAIVMMSALGDAVHVLPVANALKRAWPATRITWILQPVPHALVRGHPAVDAFLVFPRHGGPSAWYAFARELRRRRFDLLLDLQVYLKAGLVSAVARARERWGFDRARARDLNWLFTNRRIPPHPPQHVQDQYFEFLHALGVNPEPVEWGIPLTPEDRAAARAFLDALGRPACGIVVGTSKPEKNWMPDRYARVADALASEFGFAPVLLGGPGRGERAIADAILARARVPVADALADDVRRLAALIAGCRLVLSPDTGPLHIARALDVPVVGLYGYTNPKRTGPYRKFTELVVDGYARTPGEDYPCSPEVRPDGMARVTVEAVLEKVQLAVDTYLRPKPERAEPTYPVG
jgi:heptosyltransferase I